MKKTRTLLCIFVFSFFPIVCGIAEERAHMTVDMPGPAVSAPPGQSKKIVIAYPEIGSKVSADTFSMRTDATDNHEAIMRAIEYCRSNDVRRLDIPKGTYRFSMSNVITLYGFTNFRINAHGSTFIFTPTPVKKQYVQISACVRFALEDLALDWDWSVEPIASIVSVTAVDAGSRSVDLLFQDKHPSLGDDIVLTDLEPLHPERMTPDQRFFVILPGMGPKGFTEKKWVSPNVLRLTASPALAEFSRIRTNAVYRIRHYQYGGGGVRINDSSDLTISNVTVHGCMGFGFHVAGDVHHFRFNGCRVTVPPGSKRPISSAADHFHMTSAQGNFVIDGCEFAYGGDDIINIHTTAALITKILDPHTLEARVNGPTLIRTGDLIELRMPDYAPAGAMLTAVHTEYNEAGAVRSATIRFKDPLPAFAAVNGILFNRRYFTDNFIIRNNYFHDNRGRGILLEGSGGIIESNHFARHTGAALSVETVITSGWREGYGVTNIIVRNNKFEDCPFISYRTVTAAGTATPYHIFSDHLYESNTFVNLHPARLLFDIVSAQNIVIRGNSIEAVPIPGEDAMRSGIRLRFVSNVSIVQNHWKQPTIPAVVPMEKTGGIDILSNSHAR
ncbi:MAG: right-handed parallel beta-helix repeat-containing protein [Spirochaetota bacterium]